MGTAVGVRRLEDIFGRLGAGARLLLGVVCLAGMSCLVGTLHYKGACIRQKCLAAHGQY